MKAAVFEREGVLTLKEVERPRIEQPDQLLLRVDAVSICGTDVHITAVPPGYIATPNTILGHELVGTVAEIGENVRGLQVGDRVVVNPNNYCGTCVYCRKNLPNQCERIEALGIDFDGAFAEYCRVNAKVAHKISRDVPLEQAACCEPLACALSGIKKARVTPGDVCVIVGGGPIGLMIGMLLRKAGAGKVYLLEISPYRIEFTRKLGFFEVINPMQQDAREIIIGATGIGADVVFDVAGSQIVTCVDLARKGGQVVLFGVNKRARAEIAQCEITTKELNVSGTWLANATFPEAVRLLEQGGIDVGALVTEVISLDGLHAGLKKLAAGEAVKIVVKP